jgi:hypothetical protein
MHETKYVFSPDKLSGPPSDIAQGYLDYELQAARYEVSFSRAATLLARLVGDQDLAEKFEFLLAASIFDAAEMIFMA